MHVCMLFSVLEPPGPCRLPLSTHACHCVCVCVCLTVIVLSASLPIDLFSESIMNTIWEISSQSMVNAFLHVTVKELNA